MRYREIIKEVDHNPTPVKIDFDTIQTLLALGIGQGEWDTGWADVNNYIAVIGAVGHGIGTKGGVLNPQQTEPDADTAATITAKDYTADYGDDADKIGGAFNTDTGEISINQSRVANLKPLVNRIEGAKEADTIVHEMMHRGFQIISDTPELRSMMPKDMNEYWSRDWGRPAGDNYVGLIQVSAEHALIYTHSLGASRFAYEYEDKLPWRDFIRASYGTAQGAAGIEAMASMGQMIVYCRLDAVLDKDSPIYNMRPREVYLYWKDLFEDINQALATYFSRSGPPRRLGPARSKTQARRRAQADRAEEIRAALPGKITALSNTAARLMGSDYSEVLPQIQTLIDDIVEGYPVSNSWKSIVVESISKAIAQDNQRKVNEYISAVEKLKSVTPQP